MMQTHFSDICVVEFEDVSSIFLKWILATFRFIQGMFCNFVSITIETNEDFRISSSIRNITSLNSDGIIDF